MKIPKPLHYKLFRTIFNPRDLKFQSTAQLRTTTEYVGQERAVSSIGFGINIKSRGYNLFAMGPPGIGKRSLVRILLKRHAAKQLTPDDWVYLNNFVTPDNPIAVNLPAGLGKILKKDMQHLISELRVSLLTVYESDEYRNGMHAIKESFNKKRKAKGVSTKDKNNIDQIPYLYRDRHDKEKDLQRRLTLSVVKPSIIKLKNKYKAYEKIIRYLTAVQHDIVNNVNELVKPDENSGLIIFDLENPILVRYEVNLIVDNSKRKGAPVIFLERPNYSNLISRVEYKSPFGNLITDFTLIRAGALHRANGGFLIIEARKIKKDKDAWESLKSALYSRKIKIEPVEPLPEASQPITLKPQSVPLNIKVILIGNRKIYYSLSRNDPDFAELFKVAVDFDEHIPRTKKNITAYSHLIATFVRKKDLLPFKASAVAAIIDHSTRIVEDVEKLSTHILRIYDLVQESDYVAQTHNKSSVDSNDVKLAIAFQIHRLDRTRGLYYEDIKRKFVLINTSGLAVGQLNCLSVVRVGKFSYGHPTKVTAKVRTGKGKIIDIQREIKLAGPIHSKAGLILANYIADRYTQSDLFSMTASIAFEQIYGMLDGDSASVAETCALLSALTGIPLNQSFAVTGSINQYGEVQAIGGVNDKVEGYFDICHAKGLTGKQGVILPTINVKNLMLKDEVVEAAKQNKFFIYPIDTVDEAITLLTGKVAGTRNRSGQFPANSFNLLVEQKLKALAKNRYLKNK